MPSYHTGIFKNGCIRLIEVWPKADKCTVNVFFNFADSDTVDKLKPQLIKLGVEINKEDFQLIVKPNEYGKITDLLHLLTLKGALDLNKVKSKGIFDEINTLLKLQTWEERAEELEGINKKKKAGAQAAAGSIFSRTNPTLPREIGEHIGSYLKDDVGKLLLTDKEANKEGNEAIKEIENNKLKNKK